MVAFYNAKDQAIYNAGDKFIPQTKYLQSDYIPTEGISYEGDGSPVSYANSGIMTQAPIPIPLKYIPEGGGGDGPPGPDDEDDDSGYSGITGYDSLGNPISNYTSPIDALKTSFAFMNNPFGYLGYKGYKAYKDKKAKQELQDFYDAEKSAAAKKTQNMAAANKASNTGGYQAGYGGDFMDGPSGAGYGNAPSDKGGSDSMGSFAKGGRVGYFFGGRVNYKAGGRINFRGGGMDMGNEENQKQSADMGNTTVSNNNDGGNDNPPNFFVEDKTSIIDTSGLKSKSPEINIDYTDPRNYASLKGSIYNTNILDNDDINVDGTLSGEFGPVSYNTNFTDQGITGTNLTAGNFSANISPDMQLENLSYSKGPFRISSDGQNTKAGLTFSYKNGGLAGLI